MPDAVQQILSIVADDGVRSIRYNRPMEDISGINRRFADKPCSRLGRQSTEIKAYQYSGNKCSHFITS